MQTIIEKYLTAELNKKYPGVIFEVTEIKEQSTCTITCNSVRGKKIEEIKKYCTNVLQRRLNAYGIDVQIIPNINYEKNCKVKYQSEYIQKTIFTQEDFPIIKIENINALRKLEEIHAHIYSINNLIIKIDNILNTVKIS